MIVYKNLHDRHYAGDPLHMFDIEEYSNESNDNIDFYYGINYGLRTTFKLQNKNAAKKTIYMNIEEPNFFFIYGYNEFINEYDKIFTICPYTAACLNYHVDKYNKRIETFYPIDKKYIPEQPIEKTNDVIFAGSLLDFITPTIRAIKQNGIKNYIVSHSSDNPLTTHHNVSNKNKLNLYANSKIALIHNYLIPNSDHKARIQNEPLWRHNEAFKHISSHNIVPQLKSRLFEAAMSKNIILCKKDPFNIIERYFKPNEDFIYYESIDEMINLIKEISSNYHKYEHIAHNAFNKFVDNYTTEKFVENLLNPIASAQ